MKIWIPREPYQCPKALARNKIHRRPAIAQTFASAQEDPRIESIPAVTWCKKTVDSQSRSRWCAVPQRLWGIHHHHHRVFPRPFEVCRCWTNESKWWARRRFCASQSGSAGIPSLDDGEVKFSLTMLYKAKSISTIRNRSWNLTKVGLLVSVDFTRSYSGNDTSIQFICRPKGFLVHSRLSCVSSLGKFDESIYIHPNPGRSPSPNPH